MEEKWAGWKLKTGARNSISHLLWKCYLRSVLKGEYEEGTADQGECFVQYHIDEEVCCN